MSSTLTVESAQAALDAWTREMIAWHFSPATGCDYWLKWAAAAGWNPLREINCFADLRRFEHFDYSDYSSTPTLPPIKLPSNFLKL